MFRTFVLLLAMNTGGLAQTFTARITGTVTDISKAVVPGATVTVLQVGTNVRKTALTNATGVYTVPLLLPGVYDVFVEAPGLQTQIRKNVSLEVNQAATLDFELPVSQSATAVDVTAEAPLLQSETSGVGTTLETNLIVNFPLAQRDIMGLVRAIPGIVAASGVGDARGGRNVFDSNFSVAGGRTSTNEVLLDGAPNTIGDFNGVVIVPPQDSVQELRVETSSYSAEFGRSGGGTVNIVTKSGSNLLHGTAYYYHQNSALNADGFANNRFGIRRAVVRRHQYGYTLGGPVYVPKLYNGRNKTFFFSSFEGRREHDPQEGITSVPTAAEMNGDFSRTMILSSAGPQLIQIYDPATSRIENGVRIRDPFPGNMIPANRISAVAKKAMSYYPAPNRAGSSITGRQNFSYQDSTAYSRDQISGRVDHYFNEKHRLFGRFNWQQNLQAAPGDVVQLGGTAFITTVFDNFRNVALDDTYQVNSHLSNVWRYSYARFRANQLPGKSIGFDPTTLGLPSYIRDSANILFFPNFSLSDGAFPTIGGNAYNNQPRDTQSVQNQIVWIKGRHNIRAGGEFRLYRFYPFQVFNPTGGFSFSPTFTQKDFRAATRPAEGFGFASFLLGTGNFSYEHVEPLTAYHNYAGVYVQDDWKVTGKLTLNLGLRWETETGTAESHDRESYFDPTFQSPKAVPRGALLFAGNGNPHTIRATNLKDFGPRAGFAYRIRKNLVARGGYGIFYLPLGLEPTLTTTPFNYTISADVSNADGTPKATIADPFPGGIPKPSSSARVEDGTYRLGINSNVVLRNQAAGYMQEWNFGLSRQIAKATVADVTYFGSRGIHLPIPSMELNQLNPSYLAQGGAYLNELVPNPYYGQISSGLLSLAKVPRGQLLKPFPQFAGSSTADYYGGSLAYFRPPVGDSIYHAVTFKVERRFTKGLSVSGHYTISKLIDVGGVGNGNAFNDPSALRDIYNARLERSLSAWDVPQRLVVTYSYELPFGKGKQFLNRGGALTRIVGGWSLFSFHTWERGRPVNIGGPDLSRLAGAGPSRASVVYGQKDAYPLDVSIANAKDYNPLCGCTKPWFNPAAFTSTPEFQIPNGPRFLPDVRGGSPINWDLSLDKKFKIYERLTFALHGSFFNFLNQVYMSGPSVISVNQANFGSAGGVGSLPRRIEVGAKLTF